MDKIAGGAWIRDISVRIRIRASDQWIWIPILNLQDAKFYL
jgi:hypothetical protein